MSNDLDSPFEWSSAEEYLRGKQKQEHISDEQLDLDIENTHKEADAYHQLFSGFATLARLPEQDPGKVRVYHMQAIAHERSESECRDFLAKLLALKERRRRARMGEA